MITPRKRSAASKAAYGTSYDTDDSKPQEDPSKFGSTQEWDAALDRLNTQHGGNFPQMIQGEAGVARIQEEVARWRDLGLKPGQRMVKSVRNRNLGPQFGSNEDK